MSTLSNATSIDMIPWFVVKIFLFHVKPKMTIIVTTILLSPNLNKTLGCINRNYPVGSDSTYCSLNENMKETISNVIRLRLPIANIELLNKIHGRVLKHFEAKELLGNLQVISYLKIISKLNLRSYKHKYLAEKVKMSLKKIYNLNKSFEKTVSCEENIKPMNLSKHYQSTQHLELINLEQVERPHLPCNFSNDDKSFNSDMLSNNFFIENSQSNTLNSINTEQKFSKHKLHLLRNLDQKIQEKNKPSQKHMAKKKSDETFIHEVKPTDISEHLNTFTIAVSLNDCNQNNIESCSQISSSVPTKQPMVQVVFKEPSPKRKLRSKTEPFIEANMSSKHEDIIHFYRPFPANNSQPYSENSLYSFPDNGSHHGSESCNIIQKSTKIDQLPLMQTTLPTCDTKDISLKYMRTSFAKPNSNINSSPETSMDLKTCECFEDASNHHQGIFCEEIVSQSGHQISSNSILGEVIRVSSNITASANEISQYSALEHISDSSRADTSQKYSQDLNKILELSINSKITESSKLLWDNIISVSEKICQLGDIKHQIRKIGQICDQLPSRVRKQIEKHVEDVGQGVTTYQHVHEELANTEEVVNQATNKFIKFLKELSSQKEDNISEILNWPISELNNFSNEDQQKLYFWKDLLKSYLCPLKELSCYFSGINTEQELIYFDRDNTLNKMNKMCADWRINY